MRVYKESKIEENNRDMRSYMRVNDEDVQK